MEICLRAFAGEQAHVDRFMQFVVLFKEKFRKRVFIGEHVVREVVHNHMNKSKLNSTEIARLAGVSRSTVSRVINGYNNVPDETREHVMRVINENGYYPLLSGQLLAGKKTKTLGFIWVNSGNIADSVQCSAFFAHVTDSAAAHGYLVLTCIVKNLTDGENVDWVKRIFMQERVDGGVFIGVDNDEPLIEELISRGMIVGIFDHYHPDRNEPNRISVNFEVNTGEKCVDYLCELGHRNIAVIDGNMSRYSSCMRHLGYIRAMKAHGVALRPEWMLFGDLEESTGLAATNRLLALPGELPTAICANNDAVAFGVIAAIVAHGLRVPEDISVIGIDGHDRASFVSPPLTTYEFNFAQIFRSLVSRVIAVIEEKEEVKRTEFLESTLVVRNSCAPPRRP